MTQTRSKAEREALVEWNLQQILQPLGFSLRDPIPHAVRANRVWWFFRTSSRFETEAICIPLQWRPSIAITVECFASILRESELRSQGLSGDTSIGNNPYVYLVHRLDRPQDEVLPQIIALGANEQSWSAVFRRLGDELTMIEPEFWIDLQRMWQKRVAARGAG